MKGETLVIDRTFRGVGRVARSTGTLDPKVRARMSRMATALHQDGRLDLLRAVRDGQLSWLELYDAYRRKDLASIATGPTASPLANAMRAWVKGSDYSDDHRDSLETSIRYLERVQKDACVADVAALTRELRGTLGAQHARSFNLARSAAMAFVRQTLTKAHPLYLQVQAVEPRKVKRRVHSDPLSLAEMRSLFPDPEGCAVDAVAWTMATSGMHQKELWGRWTVLADRIHIGGTKRGGRVRDVPLVRPPHRPPMHRRTFENAVRERTRAIEVYDLRRTYSRWLEEAQVPRTRRKMYMGHGPKDTTDFYERHEITEFLIADAAKVRAWIDATSHPNRP